MPEAVSGILGGTEKVISIEKIGSGRTTIWKVAVKEANIADMIRVRLVDALGERCRITAHSSITEKGGYGIGSLEIIGDRDRILIYFLHERAEGPMVAREPDRTAVPIGALVIDDIGYRRDVADFFRDVDIPLTAAVLPGVPHSGEIARTLHRLGHEVLCHLPMEPDSPTANPGPGALLVSMEPAEARRVIVGDIDSIPYCTGVNNHMGSLATADSDSMRLLMEILASRNMVFLDSRTTADTVAASEARAKGVPVTSRDVFLDDLAEEPYIRSQLEQFRRLVLERGEGVAIGHPHPTTLKVLKETLPELSREIRFLTLSSYISPGG